MSPIGPASGPTTSTKFPLPRSRGFGYNECVPAVKPHPKPTRKPKKRRKQSKSERRLLEAELWKLTADYVKARDGRCVTCGATERLTLSHWIKAGKQIVRYDLRNGNTQCAPCNNSHNYNPYFYDAYMLKHYGQAIMIELTELAITHDAKNFRWSVLQLRDMVAERRADLESLS